MPSRPRSGWESGGCLQHVAMSGLSQNELGSGRKAGTGPLEEGNRRGRRDTPASNSRPGRRHSAVSGSEPKILTPLAGGCVRGTGVEEARTDLRIGVARPCPQMVLGAKESRERHAILRQSRNDMRTTTV